jgi:hypothetical protein
MPTGRETRSQHVEKIPHVENVRLIKDDSASGPGTTGFNGRYATLVFGLLWLAVLFGVAYLLGG